MRLRLALFLTSISHADHSKAVRDLLRMGVDCYMGKGTADAIGVSGQGVQVVRAQEQFGIGAWKVLPFDAVHDCAEPLGFLLSSGTEKLLYLTDSGYCKYRFDGVTHIAVECNHSVELLRQSGLSEVVQNRIMRNHMSLETLLDMLRANDLRQLREVHLLHMSDGNSNEKAFKEAVQAATGVEVYIC